jgi:MFS family permease
MTASGGETNAWAVLRESGHGPRFAVLCLGIFLQATNTTFISTLLPGTVADIGGAHLIGWAFTVYLIGSITAASATALTVRRIGLGPCLTLSALLYAAGCAVCAAAPGMEVLLAGRAVQGYGGGGIIAVTFIAVDRLFPNAILPRLQSLISVVWSAATFAGPLIGGGFATYASWRYAFWTFVALGVAYAAIAVWTMRGLSLPAAGPASRLPVRRMGLLALAILCVALAGAYPHPVTTLELLAVSAFLFVWFFSLDKSGGDSRMLPPRPLDVRTTTGAGLMMIFLLGIGTMSFAVFGPFLMIRLYDATPLIAGAMIAAESVTWGLMAVLVGGLAQRFEPLLIRAGASMVVIYIVWMTAVVPMGPLWLILPGALLAGAGFGTMYGFVIRRLVAAAPDGERDRTAGAIPTVQQTGYALAGALSGLIANAAGFSETMTDAAARSVAFWVFAAFIPLCVLGWFAAMRVARA